MTTIGASTTVWAIEPSERMCAVGQREHPHPPMRYVAGSGERIPVPDASCDAALLSYVVHT